MNKLLIAGIAVVLCCIFYATVTSLPATSSWDEFWDVFISWSLVIVPGALSVIVPLAFGIWLFGGMEKIFAAADRLANPVAPAEPRPDAATETRHAWPSSRPEPIPSPPSAPISASPSDAAGGTGTLDDLTEVTPSSPSPMLPRQGLSLPGAIASCFRNYFGFTGRASRSEFWYFALFFTIVALAAVAIASSLAPAGWTNEDGFVDDFLFLVSLPFLAPYFAVLVRRLHDTDRTGWYFAVSFIPLIGPLLAIVWAAEEGTAGPNRYGSDPLTQTVSPLPAVSDQVGEAAKRSWRDGRFFAGLALGGLVAVVGLGTIGIWLKYHDGATPSATVSPPDLAKAEPEQSQAASPVTKTPPEPTTNTQTEAAPGTPDESDQAPADESAPTDQPATPNSAAITRPTSLYDLEGGEMTSKQDLPAGSRVEIIDSGKAGWLHVWALDPDGNQSAEGYIPAWAIASAPPSR